LHCSLRPLFPWRCAAPLPRFGMNHVSIYNKSEARLRAEEGKKAEK
jgi:hypothetical protein